MILRRRKHTRAATLTAALLCLALLATTTHLSARQHAADPVYTLHVTVTDEKGNIVEGLGREAFAVFSGGRRLEIKSFSNADAPASVAVVLDASGSMSRSETARVRNALLRFFRHCHAQNEFSVGVFADGQQLLVERSNDAAAILSALDRYAASKREGDTALFDAVYLATHHVGAGRHRRRAVLLVTDGTDNHSSYTFEEMKRAVRESDATVYAVGLPEDGHPLDIEVRRILDGATAPTGGFFLTPDSGEGLNAALISVAEALRGQYAVGVAPAAATSREDGWHEVRVEMAKGVGRDGKLHKLYARTRKGFYWPARGG